MVDNYLLNAYYSQNYASITYQGLSIGIYNVYKRPNEREGGREGGWVGGRREEGRVGGRREEGRVGGWEEGREGGREGGRKDGRVGKDTRVRDVPKRKRTTKSAVLPENDVSSNFRQNLYLLLPAVT